jgi:hypothetical protein
MDQPDRHPGGRGLPGEFEDAFARLQLLLVESRRRGASWPEGVARAIVAALELAAAEPSAARALTTDALSYGAYGSYLHRKLVEYLAASLAACAGGGRREGMSELVEEALVGGVLEVVSARLRDGREDELPALATQVVELTLLPYLGVEEARRVGVEVAGG